MKDPIKAVIDEVIIQPSKIQPIIVNFQNGALKDEETSAMNCGIYHDVKRDKTVLAMSNGQVVYKGYRPDLEKELTYTMLAIHNKRTGKIRLIQAERWQVAPVLDQRVNVNDETDAMQKINQLNKQFGSKKIIRRTEQYEKMRVNIDSVKEQLEKTVSNVEIDREDLSTEASKDDAATSKNIPECNREATRVQDVYNLYDIIPKDLLDELSEQIDEILQYGTEGKSTFYTKTLKSLDSDSDRKNKIAILEYIEAVRAWLNLPFRDVKKRNLELCPYSKQLSAHVIESYSMIGTNGRQRPTSMRDKAIIRCMILALMVKNFKLDLDSFSTLFYSSRSGKKLTDLARIIGVVPTKENNKIVVLKLPLPPPVSAIRRGRKK